MEINKIKQIITIFVLALALIGCESTGPSTTDKAALEEIVYAQQVQEVFWACMEDENAKTEKYNEFVIKYGKEQTDKGIAQYEAVSVKGFKNISGVKLTPEMRAQIEKIIEEVMKKKEL